MLLHEFLERSAERLADKEALVCQGQRLSFGEIDRRSSSLGNALIDEGLRRHDRAAI
jgi:acyl-CoA synthetase (AMP-forming)/AMP-acid ligase II